MDVPGLGVKWEWQLQAYATARATGIWVTSATYAAPCGKVGPFTHWVGPVIEPASSQGQHWATTGTLCNKARFSFFFFFQSFPQYVEIPGQGSNPFHHSNQSCSCENAESLTCWAANELLSTFPFSFFFFFLWLHAWHVEGSGPGVTSEPQLHPMQQQHWILNTLHHTATPSTIPFINYLLLQDNIFYN